jgi:response regulator of citrate/malate metabolism
MNILVVDDDFMVARVHGGYVARIPGCRVIGVAHRGEEALELVAELRPDLVLLDIYLPDMSGLDVLRRLRTGAPDDPFVLASRPRTTPQRSAQRCRAAPCTTW